MLLYANVCIYLLLEINLQHKKMTDIDPETLTGTAFSIKRYAQIITYQTAAQQATTAVSVSVC